MKTAYLLVLPLLIAACGSSGDTDTPSRYPVKVGNAYGYIDLSGEFAVSPQYAYAMPFREGLAAVNVGGTPRDHDMPENGAWGFISYDGRFVINPVFASPPNGVVPWDISHAYKLMHDGYIFSEGLAAVYNGQSWIYINTRGETVISGARWNESGAIQPILSARCFSEGLAAVYTGGGWGFIDRTGMLVTPARYLIPDDMRNGFASVITPARERVLIDQSGGRLFGQYRFTGPFDGGFAGCRAAFKAERYTGAEQRHKTGLVNRKGWFVIPAQFDQTGSFDPQSGLLPVMVGAQMVKGPVFGEELHSATFQDGKWGYTDSTGNFVINPRYEEARQFSFGLAAVKTGGKWGYINTSGAYVCAPQFSFAGPFDGQLARVRLKTDQEIYRLKFGYMNVKGKVVYIED